VKRRDAPAAPAAPVDEVGLREAEAPFDNVIIDDAANAFVMVVEVPAQPDADAERRVIEAVSGCLLFRDDAGLYPEAAGREKVVRVLFHFRPDRRLLARLPLDRVQVWVYGADRKVRPLSDEELKRTVEPAPPEPERASEPGTPAPVKIDMVLEDPDTGVTVLVLVHDEPWTDEATDVRRRIDAYVRAAGSGALAKLEVGERYEIHVHCRERPGPAPLAALARTRRVLQPEGVRLRLYVVGAGAAEEIPLDR
jgi:hypothetical protein